jgi:hypothetical protein
MQPHVHPALRRLSAIISQYFINRRRRFAAATWSSVWYLLVAFAVISFTSNWAYVTFAALRSWIGGFLSITALDRVSPLWPGE